MSKTVAIIQARTGSTRLPCKVLLDIGGQTMLARTVNRTQRAYLLDQIVVATTVEPADYKIVEECRRLGVEIYRGSEQNVLDRYYQAARQFSADTVVRITSDCPLIDPGVVDELIEYFRTENSDYAINAFPQTYPRGQVAEVMKMNVLSRAWHEAVQLYERIHVTPYIYESGRFRVSSLQYERDVSQHRWTVDTEEDLAFVREVFARMGNRDNFCWTEVLDLVEEDHTLAGINQHIQQKTLHET